MDNVQQFKKMRLIFLLALPFLVFLLPDASAEGPGEFSPQKVNLALRRTADGLLRQAGDSTSRIPAIEQTAENVWQVRIEQAFDYEALPELLQSSLDQYGIQRPYEVTVLRCDNSVIDLGYQKLDLKQDTNVPCGGRVMPEGCHYIEITFSENDKKTGTWASKSWIVFIIAGGWVGFWIYNRKKTKNTAPLPQDETEWLEFGNSRLDVAGQVLVCGDQRQTLTFREAKLLKLFANNPGKLLERDFILQQVWADEGVLVGRSVDVFVSRLRKKLSPDTSLGIVAVHGVGYRMETGK